MAEAEKAGHEPEPWILGGCSGRMITTPSGYVGDGFIADVDTKANAARIVHCVNAHDNLVDALEKLTDAHAALLIMKAEDPSRFQEPGSPYAEAKRVLAAIERSSSQTESN